MSKKEKNESLTPEEKGVYLFMDEVNTETCKDLISFILSKKRLYSFIFI